MKKVLANEAKNVIGGGYAYYQTSYSRGVDPNGDAACVAHTTFVDTMGNVSEVGFAYMPLRICDIALAPRPPMPAFGGVVASPFSL